jgi:hypothetical protein
MVLTAPTAPQASQASLRADSAYVSLLEAESTWPMKYTFSRPNPVAARAYPMQGLIGSGVGSDQVAAYNRLIPHQQRTSQRASRNRPNTELFGTAPYTATGRGIMNHVDISTAIMQGNHVPNGSSRILTERQWDRRDFLTLPDDLVRLPVETRKGEWTRVGPEYLQPHD